MSRRVGTPVNQVKLSNVAVVRLQRGGVRLELACYPNKVVDYRSGLETDVDEVVQVQQVFKNASKGQVASKKELTKAFGDDASNEDIVATILKLGELQVSERERAANLEARFRDVAVVVAEKTMDAKTGRPFPASVVEKAMRDALNFTPSLSRSAKQQALEVIRKLEDSDFGLVRARMRLKIVGDDVAAAERALAAVDGVTRDGSSFLADSRAYRAAAQAVRDATAGAAALEVLEHAARVLPDATNASRPPPVDDDAAPSIRTEEEDEEEDAGSTAPTKGDDRKTKAPKKSKAARRRDKEDAQERAEEARRAEARRLERAEARREKIAEHRRDDALPPPPPPFQSKLTCNTCGGTFPDPAAHRAHFRSDWHRANLRLKLEGKPPVSEADFDEALLLQANAL